MTESTLSFLSAKEEHSGTYYCKGEDKKSTNEMTVMIFGKCVLPLAQILIIMNNELSKNDFDTLKKIEVPSLNQEFTLHEVLKLELKCLLF